MPHIVVSRTARYYVLGGDGAVREVWFLLHGYAQLASHLLRSCRSIAAADRMLVAPEALSRFYVRGTHGSVGASWMTKEDREAEIADTLGYLDAVRTVVTERCEVAPRVTVLGFSQGAAAAARWALRGAAQPHRLILWGGHLPPDVDLDAEAARLRSMGLRVVIGDDDEYITPEQAEAERARLSAFGLDAGWTPYHGPHRIVPAVLQSLADQSVRAERRV